MTIKYIKLENWNENGVKRWNIQKEEKLNQKMTEIYVTRIRQYLSENCNGTHTLDSVFISYLYLSLLKFYQSLDVKTYKYQQNFHINLIHNYTTVTSRKVFFFISGLAESFFSVTSEDNGIPKMRKFY